jgi:hypothetical protein
MAATGEYVTVSGSAPHISDRSATMTAMVQDRFDTAEGYAEENLALAHAQIDAITTLLNSLEVPTTESLEDITIPEIVPLDYASRPAVGSLIESFPEFAQELPTEPAMEDVPDIDSGLVPTQNFDFIENIIPAPAASTVTAPSGDISMHSIPIPAKPDYTTPAAPSFDEIATIAPPDISLPQFDIDRPTLESVSAPSPFSYTEAAYNSDLWQDLIDKVLDGVRNGGTGLSAEVEADLYARLTERQRVENERLYREIENAFTATGFPLPTGALASRLAEVSMEISRKNDQTSREITINQAELAQKNTQFIIDKGVQLEDIARNFFNAVSNRSLDAAKAIAQVSIDIFNTVLARYGAQIEGYKAEAAVFAERVKAAMYQVEVYKAQVEGQKTQAQVQSVRADVYKTEMEALNTVANIYRVEMESAKIQSEIEMTKIAVFKAQTEAYVAQLEGEKNKYIVYTAQMEGEKVRAQVFSEQIKAYAVKVDAAKSVAQIEAMSAENVLKKNQLLIDKYKAQLQGYLATIEAELKTADMQTKAFGMEVTAYNAETEAVKAENLVKIQEMTAGIQQAELRLRKAVAQIESATQGYVALKSLQEKGESGIMNVMAQLAASAMNAVNASATVGASFSGSESNSSSWGASLSESHEWKHEP